MAKIRRRYGRRYSGALRLANGKWTERALTTSRETSRRMLSRLQEAEDRKAKGFGDELQGEMLISNVITQWGQHLREHRTAKHARDSENGASNVLAKIRTIGDITPIYLDRAIIRLRDEGRSARTCDKLLGYVGSMLRWAEGCRIIARNPVARMPRFQVQEADLRKRRYRFTIEEARRLQEAADRRGAIGDLIAMALGTGLRLQNMIDLDIKDWDPKSRQLRALRTKSKKILAVSVPGWLAVRITEMIQRSGRRLERLPSPDDPLLIAPRGKRWHAKSAWKSLNYLLTLAGIEKVHPDGTSIDWHSFRHTVATTIAERGWSELQLQRFMGWETASMARKYVDLARIPTDGVANDLPDPMGKAKKKTKRGRA